MIGRIFFLKNAKFIDCFINDHLQFVEGIVIIGIKRLKDMIFYFSLKIFDAVVLLLPSQTGAPGMTVDDGQNSLLLTFGDEVGNVP